MARENYPLIKRYDLIKSTTEYNVSNIVKGWLPQIAASAGASLQSDVMTLPDPLQNMLTAQGYDVKGLKKDQYKIGIDVNQTLWDGGAMSAQSRVARLEGQVQEAQTDVDMYAIRQRVNELYFGILLLDSRIELVGDLIYLLNSNLEKLESMCRNGIALQCDVNLVKAEVLKAEQTMIDLEASRGSLCQMLGNFIGSDVEKVVKPSEAVLDGINRRPELAMFDSQLKLFVAKEKMVNSTLLPRISLYAQGYYGYPGLDMFHDMFHHDFSLNGIVGARITWNISAFYRSGNEKSKIAAGKSMVENARETFMFNNKLLQTQYRAGADKYRKMLDQDRELVELRSEVRRAAESKLSHGIIDTNNLLQEITRENQANIDMQTHELLMLKEIYELKHTLND